MEKRCSFEPVTETRILRQRSLKGEKFAVRQKSLSIREKLSIVRRSESCPLNNNVVFRLDCLLSLNEG